MTSRCLPAKRTKSAVTEAGKAFGVTPRIGVIGIWSQASLENSPASSSAERSLEEFSCVRDVPRHGSYAGGQAFVVALYCDTVRGKSSHWAVWEGASRTIQISASKLEDSSSDAD